MSIDVNCAAWQGFRTGEWRHLVNVRNFIQKNYTPTPGRRFSGRDFHKNCGSVEKGPGPHH